MHYGVLHVRHLSIRSLISYARFLFPLQLRIYGEVLLSIEPVNYSTKFNSIIVSWLVQQYASLAVEFQQSLKIVFPLRSFLRRLHQHDQNTITPVHAQFLYICHQAKCYSVAMETLNQ